MCVFPIETFEPLDRFVRTFAYGIRINYQLDAVEYIFTLATYTIGVTYILSIPTKIHIELDNIQGVSRL